jgi:hypothetical protein
MPMDAMFMDDPPHVNCRAKSYSAADHLINPRSGHFGRNGNVSTTIGENSCFALGKATQLPA